MSGWCVYRGPDGKPQAELSFFVPKDCRIVVPDLPTREAASKAAAELRAADEFAAALALGSEICDGGKSVERRDCTVAVVGVEAKMFGRRP